MMADPQTTNQSPTETKTVHIAGFTEDQRKKELDRVSTKLSSQGWSIESYHDEGMTNSSATFTRPLLLNEKTNKQKSSKMQSAVVLILLIIGAIYFFTGENETTTSQASQGGSELLSMNLAAYSEAQKNERLAAIKAYLSDNSISSDLEENIYNFMSEAAYTKSKDLNVAEVLGWAKSEIEQNNGKLERDYYNLDDISSQFSSWDGSHRKLVAHIKRNMNDEDSFSHIETRYRIVLNGQEAPHLFLVTEFSGRNAFGGTVKNSAFAKARLTDGEIIELEFQ